MQIYEMDDQLCLFVPDSWSGKTSPVYSPAGSRRARISGLSWRKLSELSAAAYQSLDLTPGSGNLLGEFYWELNSPWRGERSTLNTGVSPKDAVVSSLSQILEAKPHPKYYLSRTACLGILRRAQERGKELPPQLKAALMMQAGLTQRLSSEIQAGDAYHINQRNEGIDLHGVSGALMHTQNMQMQTFFTQPEKHIAAFSAGAGPSAGGIGYTEEGTPTLKGSAGGNMIPAVLCINDQDRRHIEWSENIASTLLSQASGQQAILGGPEKSVLCLNDQGGEVMDWSKEVSGTLRAQEHGHQPLVMATQQGGAEIGEGVCPTITSAAGTSGNNQPVLFENHGIDSRYTGPHPVAPTMSARYGTGGNNVPLIEQEAAPTMCIMGNAIDRQPYNGGNGIGYQEDLAYTLTATDHHAVFSRQRVDVFQENGVVSTESARQHKDATDLVLQKAKDASIGSRHVSQDKCAVEVPQLIRRLTPLECERLQGFPDGWTDIPGASDSSRYKVLGNSVAIPCVEYIMAGIAAALGSNAA